MDDDMMPDPQGEGAASFLRWQAVPVPCRLQVAGGRSEWTARKFCSEKFLAAVLVNQRNQSRSTQTDIFILPINPSPAFVATTQISQTAII